jgi:hypothetical protein
MRGSGLQEKMKKKRKGKIRGRIVILLFKNPFST